MKGKFVNKIISILIADDDHDKSCDLAQLMNDNYDSLSIDYSISFNSTSKKLKANCYDLILLDMSMPSFDPKPGRSKASVKALAGKDIMLKMRYRGILAPVIVVTQFDVFGRHSDSVELDKLIYDLRLDFPENFRGCVFYNTQSASWKTELIDIIEGILSE